MSTMIENSKNKEYWLKRRKNNEAARRSREKRRMNDMLLERRVMQLTEENKNLKTQLLSIKIKYGELDGSKYSLSMDADVNNSFSELSDSRFLHLKKRSCDDSDNLNPSTIQDEKDESVNTSKSNKFTSQVITNANGDTSATVLVNSADFPRIPDSLSSLHFDENMSRIMSKSLNSDHNQDIGARCSKTNDAIEKFAPDIFGKRDSPPKISSSAESELYEQNIYLKADGEKDGASSSKTAMDISSGLDSSVPLWAGIPTILPPAMITLLQDCTRTYESQLRKYLSVPQPMLPFELMLQQIHTQLSKVYEKTNIPNCPEKNIGQDFMQDDATDGNSALLLEQLRQHSELFRMPSTFRHQSRDSGFDCNEGMDAIPASSPLSPPPSPEAHRTPKEHASSIFPGMRKRSCDNSQDMKKKQSIDADHEENTKQIPLKISRSKSTSTVCCNKKIDQARKRKSEYQLPHKLRLKKCSTKSDSDITLIEKNTLETPRSVDNLKVLNYTKTSENMCNPLTQKERVISPPIATNTETEQPLNLQAKHRRFSIANSNLFSKRSDMRDVDSNNSKRLSVCGNFADVVNNTRESMLSATFL